MKRGGRLRAKRGRYGSGRSVSVSSGLLRPGEPPPPEESWTHVYSKEKGGLETCQGMRCKILERYAVGLVRIEFEDGRTAVIRTESIKPLPERKQ